MHQAAWEGQRKVGRDIQPACLASRLSARYHSVGGIAHRCSSDSLVRRVMEALRSTRRRLSEVPSTSCAALAVVLCPLQVALLPDTTESTPALALTLTLNLTAGSPLAENSEYARTRGGQPMWSQSDSVVHLGAGSTSSGSRYGSQADGRKRGARGRLSGPDATAAPRTGFATAVVDETYYSTSPGVDYDSRDFYSERESEDPYPSNGAPPWPQEGIRSWLYTGRPLPPWRQRGPGTGRY